MAGEWKVSFHIQEQWSVASGWTMNFWNNIQAIDTLKPIVLTLSDLLDGILGGQATQHAYSIRSVDTARKVYNKTFEDAAPAAVTATNDTDVPNTAGLLQLRASTTEYTNQWFRGLRDQGIETIGKFNQNKATWKQGILDFYAHLKVGANGWCIRQMTRPTIEKEISGMDPVTGVITLKAGHGWDLNSVHKVRIKGVSTPYAANGIKKVQATTTTTLTIQPWIPLDSQLVTVLRTTASVAEAAWSYKPITDAEFLRTTTHKTGRPTRVSSGRRKVRR